MTDWIPLDEKELLRETSGEAYDNTSPQEFQVSAYALLLQQLMGNAGHGVVDADPTSGARACVPRPHTYSFGNCWGSGGLAVRPRDT